MTVAIVSTRDTTTKTQMYSETMALLVGKLNNVVENTDWSGPSNVSQSSEDEMYK